MSTHQTTEKPTTNGNGNGYSFSFGGMVRAVRDVGFPIIISLYLLLSLNPKIDRMIEQQTQLINILLQQKSADKR